MFKKPIKASSKNQLSGKDKKDLKLHLLSAFHPPSVQAFFTSNSKLISQKITDLKLSILVNQQQDPMFVCFSKQNIYIPTLYLIAQYPDLVKAIWLKEGVEQFVVKGANVMCPGVEVFPELAEGAVVAVKSSKGIGMAVGYMGVSGKEGVACTVVHYLGDKLWEYGSKMISPVKYAEEKKQVKQEKEKVSEEKQSEKKQDTTNPLLPTEPKIQSQPPITNQQSQSQASQSQQDKDTKDQHLQQALYNSIKLFKFTKQQFPIPITTFFSKYIKVASPVPLDVSNSSYKKVSTFFQKMAERGLVELGKWKQKSGNTISIIGVDRTHQALKQFKPTLGQLPNTEKEEIKLEKFKIICEQKLQTWYQLTPKIEFLRQFTKDPSDKQKVFEQRQLQYLITRYLAHHKIKKYNKQIDVKQKNKTIKLKKQFIDIPYLDLPELTAIIQPQIDYHLNNFRLEQELNQTVDNPVLKQIVSLQLQFFKKSIFRQTTEQTQLIDEKTNQVVTLSNKQKQFSKIKVEAFKSHNKNVTTISHLEPYLNPDEDQYEQLQELSHYLQLRYACGSVVREATDGGKFEVYLQGNMYTEVVEFLTVEQGVDQSLIMGVNKLPKKKKK